ncbi:MAG TPA: dienelactone hydrolase family protein [Phycisphaerae bacterium]|nr:dienelactone hydrolase family protein [Phycisphaerae bacterium]
MNETALRERVRIRTGGASLSGELAYPGRAVVRACLLLNPHPYMGGRMANPLIERLAIRLAERGAVTLRFDYSGVGDSGGPAVNVAESMTRFWETGTAPIDPQMLADGRAALDWLRSETAMSIVLIGYSFGAYVADTLVDPRISAVVFISPTIGQHDLCGVEGTSVPKLVIYGESDFAVSREKVQKWYASLTEPRQLHWVRAGEHFFRGQEADVADACAAFVEETFCIESCMP